MTNVNSNTLLLWLFQIYSTAPAAPTSVKGFRPVCDSDLNCEKVCVDFVNGDTLELVVDDEDRSVYVTFIPKQKETDPNKIAKGNVVYPINKWPTRLESAPVSAYLAKLIYVTKDVLAKYDAGEFELTLHLE